MREAANDDSLLVWYRGRYPEFEADLLDVAVNNRAFRFKQRTMFGVVQLYFKISWLMLVYDTDQFWTVMLAVFLAKYTIAKQVLVQAKLVKALGKSYVFLRGCPAYGEPDPVELRCNNLHAIMGQGFSLMFVLVFMAINSVRIVGSMICNGVYNIGDGFGCLQ
mmetsp:Transcript_96704/g.191725  ORF Transcript_96704/g.191725 Transcript_96704/m.191725 type:complete len:163 (+) Transcript_96704:1060-1548(+)